MSTVLLGDVGGTRARFALARGRGAPGPVREYANDDFSSFEQLLSAHCGTLDAEPQRCLLAVAGPVRDGEVHMTNRGWRLAESALAAACGFAQVHIVNDFEALAWATLDFASGDVDWQGKAELEPAAARVVVGPGTGLGVAALLPAGDGWTVAAGEGGHVTLAASTAEEAGVIAGLRDRYGHCSAERLLSGPGLVELAAALGYGDQSPAAVGAWIAAGDSRGAHIARVFAELLGTVAGDLALTFAARGGVYLAGGILPRLGQGFPMAAFRQRFVAKGRCAGYLRAVPVGTVVRPHPAFVGLLRLSQD